MTKGHHVDLTSGFGYFLDVFGQAFHVVEDTLDTFLFLREVIYQDFDVAREVFVWNTNVIVGQDKPVEVRMRHKLDILDLRETRYQVMNSISFLDSCGMQGDIEDKSFSLEGRRVSSGLAVMLENQGLESLPGKGRGAAQPAKASADDQSIKIICSFAFLSALRESFPIESR